MRRAANVPTVRADTSEPGDLWFTHRDPDDDGARDGHPFWQSWLELQPYGDRFVQAFMSSQLLRSEYYSIARSWREVKGTRHVQFGEKWCHLLEGVLGLAPGTLQSRDFASMHKYLFWMLATAIYQQTGKQIESFPPHDDILSIDTFHGVPNGGGGGGGGLPPGGLNIPP